MEPSRIRALVTAFAPVPGSNPHAAALLGMARALRAELDMVSVKTENLAHMESFGDSRMFRVPVTGSHEEQRAMFGRAIARQLEAQLYDVVHVRGPFEGMVVAERHREMGFRFVYEVATFPDEAEGPAVEEAWADAHQHCLEQADLVLVATEAATRSLADKGFAGKVAVVQPGVNVEIFDWWPSLQDEVLRMLYLGSFAADRDLGTVLGAIRKIATHKPLRVMIAGEPDPDRRQRIRSMVEAFELAHVVEVRGEPHAASQPSLIVSCDLGVVSAAATPRFQELGDVPQPLLEYMACRRPIVAAGVPGVAEILRDEREGLLYVPSDEDTLAEAVLTLVDTPTTRERLVEAAYDRVRWEFSASARRRRIAEVYEMLMPGSQRYDAWNEGFDLEATGQVELPSDAYEPIPSSPGTSVAPSSTDERRIDTDESIDYPAPREDTSPELAPQNGPAPQAADAGDTETPAEHTRVDTVPGVSLDTDETGTGPTTEENRPDDDR